MRKQAIIIILFVAMSQQSEAQSNSKNERVLNEKEKKEVIKSLNIDSTKLLSEMAENACKCIDSISLINKSRDEAVQSINKCIDAQIGAYQMGLALMSSLKTLDKKEIKISLNTSKDSYEYKKSYYQFEAWLKDSCQSLNVAINSENKESENSLSKNKEALSSYEKGIKYFKNDDYAAALPYFETAVNIDPKFAFAWDNIGVCNRKLGNLEKALEAYQKSLAIDPKGQLPLQNIAIVYIHMKEYDKAIDAYNQLSVIFPSDPEVFYGIGNVYFNNKNDMEKALDNMCKAYNLYTKLKSPYRVDAQKVINMIYAKMKTDGKEEAFFKILKDNDIDVNKK